MPKIRLHIVSAAALAAMLDQDALALVQSAPHDALRLALMASLLRQGVMP